MKRELSVVVVDDNPAAREAITDQLRQIPVLESVQEMSGTELDRVTRTISEYPDTVVLLDYDSALKAFNGNVENWLERIGPQLPFNCGVVVYAKTSDELLAVRMIKAGAADYLPKRLVTRFLLEQTLEPFVQRLQRNATRWGRRASDRRDSTARPSSSLPQLNGYEIHRKLYDSRFVEIYLGRNSELDETVVLKIARKAANSAEDLQRFEREFAAMDRMNVPSVVNVFDYGSNEDFAYIAMEHFPAGSLKERMANPVSQQQAVEYMRQIAVAVGQVHEVGIIHRDLKPPNVMLRENNTVALIDFGIVKEVGEATGLTRNGELRGSPYYMSPEQATGGKVDLRSDMYSLGVIFYELLTGRKPYVGRQIMDILRQHTEAPVPKLATDLARFQPVLDSLMAKQHDARCSGVEQLLAFDVFGNLAA